MARGDGSGFIGSVQGLFEEKDVLKRFLEEMLREIMAAEIERHLGAGAYERTGTRRGQRNGTKPRTLKTRVGELAFRVPQSRGCEPYHPSVFARWQRSERALLVACAEMYFQGVSTRKVQEVLEKMGGMDISAAQVSRMASELDEKLSAFRCRRLEGEEYPYLIVDARYEKARENGHVVSRAVLVTVGISSSGRREVLDWRIGDSESEDTWGEVFRDLKDRGLRGVMLVTSDAHRGIRAALSRHFQGVAWQRCRVHFRRELMRKVNWKLGRELMRDIGTVFRPEERRECLRRAEEMASRWEGISPKAAGMLRENFEPCLTVCGLPAEHRLRLNSTNMLERVMKQIKDRTKVVGIFPGAESCDRLVGAKLLELDEKWRIEKRAYLSMQCLETPEYGKVFTEAAAD